MGKLSVLLSSHVRGFIVWALVVGLFSGGISVAGADCPNSVTPISKGQVAVCDGYLFSPHAESEAWKATKLADLREQENKILERRLELYIKQSDTLAQEVAKRDNYEGLYRLGYFVIGAVLTGVIAKNVSR